MGFDIPDFASLLELEPHGPDTFVGISPDYPWGRVYGGQVVAQGLRAAAATVEPDRRVHSVHGFFIRGGDSDEPIRFEVDRIRNGRSFTTRRVVARQSNGAILNLAASFHTVEAEVDNQVVQMPSVPAPDQIDDASPLWSSFLDRRMVPDPDEPGAAAAWLKIADDLGDDHVMHACALAYLSDDIPTDAARSTHPRTLDGRDHHEVFQGASLDHAIWFHRDVAADEWHLHHFDGSGVAGGRGMAIGHVFTTGGVQVATVAQEVLLRERR